MPKTNVAFWGASGHAKAVANALRFNPDIEIIGYLDDVNIDRHGQEYEGKPILGGCEQLEALKERGIISFVLGFGHCRRRIEVGNLLLQKGFKLLSVLHPKAIIAQDAVIGEGAVILAGAVVDPDVGSVIIPLSIMVPLSAMSVVSVTVHIFVPVPRSPARRSSDRGVGLASAQRSLTKLLSVITSLSAPVL
jgi:hypothetical protein